MYYVYFIILKNSHFDKVSQYFDDVPRFRQFLKSEFDLQRGVTARLVIVFVPYMCVSVCLNGFNGLSGDHIMRNGTKVITIAITTLTGESLVE